MNTRQRGFTMTELMVATGLASILLALAMPSFQRTLQNNRITTVTNKFLGDLRLARSEAMKRGQRVMVCRSANATSNAPACGGDSGNWDAGWLVFVNADNNGTYDAGVDTLLRVGEPLEMAQLAIGANDAGSVDVVFNPDASTNENGNTLRWAVCDNRGTEYGRQIELTPSGRPRLTHVTNCATPT